MIIIIMIEGPFTPYLALGMLGDFPPNCFRGYQSGEFKERLGRGKG